MSVHVFVGPTLTANDVAAARPDAIVQPPVAHGDLMRLGLGVGDTAVIIDGYFHHVASVRHKEILWLLASGVRVVGCASMGALRAAELAAFGMIGNGTVFAMYRDGTIDADDEVTVRHAEGPDYRPLGVPLVTVRCAVLAARSAGALTGEEADAIVTLAQSLHYSERSWPAIDRAASRDHPRWTDVSRRLDPFLVAHPHLADVKASDALDTLRRLDDLDRPDDAVPHRVEPDWTDSPGWQNRLLTHWKLAFTDAYELLHHHQIYRADFPARWSRFALRGVGGGPVESLAVAAAHGITPESVSAAQRREWLTDREATTLSGDAVVLRILVRSYRPRQGLGDLLSTAADLVADPQARRAVAESAAVNAEIAGWAPKQSPAYLKYALLRAHLSEMWQPDGDDDRSLTAAARDRGFATLPEAIEAVRPFFLRNHVRAMDDGPATVGAG